MAGEKKPKNKVYFVGQYNNNPKVYINFVSQYIMPDFSLGFELSKMDSEQKSNRKLSEQLSISMLNNKPIYLSAFRVC